MTVITGILDSVTFTTYHVFTTKQTGTYLQDHLTMKSSLTKLSRQFPLRCHLHIQQRGARVQNRADDCRLDQFVRQITRPI